MNGMRSSVKHHKAWSWNRGGQELKTDLMKTHAFVLICFLVHQLFAQEFIYDFSQDHQEWVHGFADYEIGTDSLFDFDFQWTGLPLPLDVNQKSLFISGKNISDDLFMYLKRKITGLLPHITYEVTFDVEFASIYPTNAVGVGGAPGEAVMMKAGAVLFEPDRIPDTIYMGTPSSPYWMMNLDKNNQISPGTDMDTIGHVGVSDTTTVYTLKTNTNEGRPFLITTDSTGEVWICIGTDSGFESTTALYYNRIRIYFNEVVTIVPDYNANIERIVFPNPSAGIIRFKNAHLFTRFHIFTIDGKLIKKIENPTLTQQIYLKPGVYIFTGYRHKNSKTQEKFIVY
jgi:hypothetical protein